jgi:hypothetical protein
LPWDRHQALANRILLDERQHFLVQASKFRAQLIPGSKQRLQEFFQIEHSPGESGRSRSSRAIRCSNTPDAPSSNALFQEWIIVG